MNSKNVLMFLLVTAVISLLAYTAIFGLDIGKFDVIPVKNLIKLGLDLRGGATVLLEADVDPSSDEDNDKMDRAIETLRRRIDNLGVSEPSIVKYGSNRIEIQLPEIQDPQRALDVIGKTALLEFKDEEGNVVLTGEDIKNAGLSFGQQNDAEVSLELNSEGSKKFAEATKANVGKKIGIYLDDEVISNPIVNSVIYDGKAVIQGMASIEEATDLATLIRAGALPVELETLQVTAVGPQLGANAFSKSVKAGQIGIIIVILFMILYYRIPGLVANIALALFLTITVIILASINATLTLPGIAGIILSAGMAVDANVIIFERIKEELRIGKTLRASMDSGFRRAFLTILDSNITTLIAAGVLYWLGTGPIKGFAVTLSIGILASMFTALVITRYMLKLLVNSELIKNKKLFGA